MGNKVSEKPGPAASATNGEGRRASLWGYRLAVIKA
nr:MAG TPA: hypothetical protein [Caudoviricetes sp.]